MAEYSIRLVTRHDTLSNWVGSESIIKEGEIAIAFKDLKVNGVYVPIELKMGAGVRWRDTPQGLMAFDPIITTMGRDLNNPGGTRNATWNWTNFNDALQELYAPYVAPGIQLSPTNKPNLEVGTTVTYTNEAFNAALFNAKNILIEGNKKIYIDGTARALFDQTNNVVNEVITKTVIANLSVYGDFTLLTVMVKNAKDSAQVTVTAKVTFKYRSGYFLWNDADNLMGKTDSQITTIINALGDNITGSKFTGIDANGDKNFGRISFDTNSVINSNPAYAGPTGYYNLYVFNPMTQGTPIISTPGDETTPIQDIDYKTFNLVVGTATTSYKLTKLRSTSRFNGSGVTLNIN